MQKIDKQTLSPQLIQTGKTDYKPDQYAHIELSEAESSDAIYAAKRRKQDNNNLSVSIQHITLSEAETQEALRLGRMKKHGEIETQKYFERVHKPVEIPKFTTEQFKQIVLYNSSKILKFQFIVDEDNQQVFNAMCMYFNADPEFCKLKEGYSLDKGLLLAGPVGVGKTAMFRLFKENPLQSFDVVSVEDICDRYEREGNEVLSSYAFAKTRSANIFGQKELGYLFDDLGAEMETEGVRKHYSNSSNVMSDIIKKRYNNGLANNLTHFTTNLAFKQIQDLYGERAYDRMKQMFNTLYFEPTCKSRRK